MYGVCIFYLDTIASQHPRIDIATVVLVLKNLCVHVIVCVLRVIKSTQVPRCPCRGHRGALGVSLDLPPFIGQDLFAVGHCVYQAS